MSSKGKKYKKMVKQVKTQEFWGCSNPSVINKTLMCDGDCSKCGYKYVIEARKIC